MNINDTKEILNVLRKYIDTYSLKDAFGELKTTKAYKQNIELHGVVNQIHNYLRNIKCFCPADCGAEFDPYGILSENEYECPSCGMSMDFLGDPPKEITNYLRKIKW